MKADGTVIGCVWGAHRALAETHPGIPYDWCEAEYVGRLRKKAPPAGNALPGWLRSELLWAWRAQQGGDRPRVERQLSLFEAS